MATIVEPTYTGETSIKRFTCIEWGDRHVWQRKDGQVVTYLSTEGPGSKKLLSARVYPPGTVVEIFHRCTVYVNGDE